MRINILPYFVFVGNVWITFCDCSDSENGVCPEVVTCQKQCKIDILNNLELNGDACDRGCIFYSTLYAVSSEEARIASKENAESDLIIQCNGDCEVSYGSISGTSLESCKLGCQNEQKAVIENLHIGARTDEKTDQSSDVHTIQPLAQIQEVFMTIGKGLSVMKTYVVTYFLVDNEKVLSVKVPKSTVIEMNLGEDADEVEGSVDGSQLGIGSNNAVPQAEDGLVSNSGVQKLVKEGKVQIEELSYSLGVPPFVVIISFVCLLIFACYLITVLLSSVIRKKPKNETGALPIPAKSLPIQLVRPEDLTKLSLIDEEETQAPALPHKVVKLPQQEII